MTKKEVIKLLDKEVGLAIIEEDENYDGDLYITSAQLKTADEVLKQLKSKTKKAEERRQYYIKRLKEVGKEKNIIFEKADDKIISGCKIILNEKLYLVGDNNSIISNCFSVTKNKKIVAE